jgi:undecaprenyl-phosphate galactose phosphotransferase
MIPQPKVIPKAVSIQSATVPPTIDNRPAAIKFLHENIRNTKVKNMHDQRLESLEHLSILENQKSSIQARFAVLKRKILLQALLLATDVIALLAAFVIGDLIVKIYHHHPDYYRVMEFYDTHHVVNLLTFAMLSAIAIRQFHVSGHYNRRLAFWDEMGSILFVLSTALALNAAVAFAGKWQLSRLWMFSAWLVAVVLLILFRVTSLAIANRIGLLEGPTVIVGCGTNAKETIKALAGERFLGCQPRWLVVPAGASIDPGRFAPSLEILDLGESPLKTLASLGNPLVIAALDPGQWDPMQGLIRLLGLSYSNLVLSPPLRRLPLCGLETMHFFGHDVLMLRTRDNLASLGARLVKRVFDLVVATLLLVLLTPLGLYIGVRIARADGGCVFYRQTRVGRYGRDFQCFKFRSMIVNADAVLTGHLSSNPDAQAEYEKSFKLVDDPRITRFGALLRRTSLDELPQLLNVLRGEMSLVGPRPVTRSELMIHYGDLAATYTRVLPGITGLWQTSGRSDTTYAQRITYDVWYVKNWNLWYDIVILLRTVRTVTSRTGAY